MGFAAEMWNSMGGVGKSVVLILLLMSVYSIGVMVERMLTIKKARDESLKFANKLATMLEAGEYDDALATAESMKLGYLPRVLASGLKEYNFLVKQPHRTQEEVLGLSEKAMERTGSRVLSDLKRGLGGLGTIGSSAPFVGLFGTVAGIIKAFADMAEKGSGGLATVSAGISEALYTTALGLVVAIPAVAIYNFLTNTLENVAVDIGEAGGELIAHLARTESNSEKEAA